MDRGTTISNNEWKGRNELTSSPPRTGYFHGSLKHGISSFSLDTADSGAYWGPGLYMTRSASTAGYYSRQSGCIYEIELTGSMELTVDLHASWRNLTVAARMAIQDIRKQYNAGPETSLMAKDILYFDTLNVSKATINQQLAYRGIWLIYGDLDGWGSGNMDKGVQYVGLDTSQLNIKSSFAATRTSGELTPEEYCNSCRRRKRGQ